MFYKNLIFPDFRLIEPIFRSIEIAIKIFCLSLPDSIDVRSTLDRSQLKIFQFRSIENRSNINRVRQTQTKNFNRNFDWSKNRFDRSKFWKNQIFEKQSILMQEFLKAHYFIKKMHEYETKSFSKTLEFNPDLPKSRFSINLSSKCKY